MTTLKQTHAAIVDSRTMYSKNVHTLDTYAHKALKGPRLIKSLVARLPRASLPVCLSIPLTLEERKTCDSACEHG